MALGRSATKVDWDRDMGAVATSLFATMDNIGKMKAVLDTLSVTDLQALGYTSGEANQIKSAFTDMATLRAAFLGTGTITPTYDFRTFSKLLLGDGLY